MRTWLAIACLALAACTPKQEELAGGPATDTNGGELAGGASAAEIVLPGVLNLVPPPGVKVVKACEKIVAPDYDRPPAMDCILSLGAAPAPAAHSEETDAGLNAAMQAAGWTFLRAMGAERYFERAKPGTDCADLAVMIVLEADQLEGLIAAVKADAPPAGKTWRAHAFPASVREACGADRMTR